MMKKKNDVDTYKSKNEVVEQASKKAPTEVKSCEQLRSLLGYF